MRRALVSTKPSRCPDSTMRTTAPDRTWELSKPGRRRYASDWMRTGPNGARGLRATAERRLAVVYALFTFGLGCSSEDEKNSAHPSDASSSDSATTDAEPSTPNVNNA